MKRKTGKSGGETVGPSSSHKKRPGRPSTGNNPRLQCKLPPGVMDALDKIKEMTYVSRTDALKNSILLTLMILEEMQDPDVRLALVNKETKETEYLRIFVPGDSGSARKAKRESSDTLSGSGSDRHGTLVNDPEGS